MGGLRFVMVLLHAARQGFRLGKKKNGLASFLHKTISGEDYRLPSGSSNIIFFFAHPNLPGTIYIYLDSKILATLLLWYI